MNKNLIIAKVRRWQAELEEVVEALNLEGKTGPVRDLLSKRVKDMEQFIKTIEENSLIPQGDVAFEPEPVMDEIARKVSKVKEGVRKIKKLSKEKTKIIQEMVEEG